jgi:phosphoribosylformylglycinamidine synthase
MFPGINAEQEMIHTLRDVCGIETTVVWHGDTTLAGNTDLVVIPGGFSYGDYLRCGALARTSPICPAIREHARRGGYVLGVCNGFQILTEIGLIEGALTRNVHLRFACHDVFVKVTGTGPFTPEKNAIWKLVIAHGDGRYQVDRETLRRLEGEGRIALRYCTATGEVTDDVNPNGAIENIAGVYGGVRKNVFGLMPHPERSSEALLGSADGQKLFLAVKMATAA